MTDILFDVLNLQRVYTVHIILWYYYLQQTNTLSNNMLTVAVKWKVLSVSKKPNDNYYSYEVRSPVRVKINQMYKQIIYIIYRYIYFLLTI